MASYKDILKLIREGKTPDEIRAAVPVPLYTLRRLLGSTRLAANLEMDRQFSGRLGRHRLAAAMHHVIGRRLEIVDDENPQTACKAAEKLTEDYCTPVKGQNAKEAEKEMQFQQKLDFIVELWGAGVVNGHMISKNLETGKYGFEEAIERRKNGVREP